jgi:hypothetical protein
MLLKTQNPHDTSPHHQRSLIHILAITFCIILSIAFIATICILSLLNPTHIQSFLSSLIPLLHLLVKTTIYLLLLYLLYSLLQALHLCIYMMKRQHEWHRAQEQIFGHAKMCFAGQWYVPSLYFVWKNAEFETVAKYLAGPLTDFEHWLVCVYLSLTPKVFSPITYCFRHRWGSQSGIPA